MCVARTTQDSFFCCPSPWGVRGTRSRKLVRGLGVCTGLEEHWGGWLPQGPGRRKGQRHPPAAGEGSGGFHQRQEGKPSKTATSSVPEPPGRPRHLAENGARVLGKLKIDSGLFSHCREQVVRLQARTQWPPSTYSAAPRGRLPSLQRTLSPLVPNSAALGTCSWKPSKGSSSQPETLPLLSPHLSRQQQRRPLLCLHPAQLQPRGTATLGATSSLQGEGSCLGDEPLGWWEQAEAF